MPFYGQSSAKKASGGEVCHLESRLRMRFAPRSSGQITFALGFGFNQDCFLRPVYKTHSFKSGKRLAPGRAAGGIFNPAASGGEGGEATWAKTPRKWVA
jgi:hypothetical protein